MRLRFVIITVCCFLTLAVQADEGMWMLGNLNKQTRRTMKELGLQMPADFVREWSCRKTDWYLRIIIAVSAVSSNILLWRMII